jgi:hypothetical protein
MKRISLLLWPGADACSSAPNLEKQYPNVFGTGRVLHGTLVWILGVRFRDFCQSVGANEIYLSVSNLPVPYLSVWLNTPSAKCCLRFCHSEL